MPDTRGAVTNALMGQPSGFTAMAPRPQMAPQPAGFAPPPALAGGYAAPSLPTGAGGGAGLFAPPPVAGAGMPPPMANAVAPRPRPAFNAQFSPGALMYPGGNAMRGRGY